MLVWLGWVGLGWVVWSGWAIGWFGWVATNLTCWVQEVVARTLNQAPQLPVSSTTETANLAACA